MEEMRAGQEKQKAENLLANKIFQINFVTGDDSRELASWGVGGLRELGG